MGIKEKAAPEGNSLLLYHFSRLSTIVTPSNNVLLLDKLPRVTALSLELDSQTALLSNPLRILRRLHSKSTLMKRAKRRRK